MNLNESAILRRAESGRNAMENRGTVLETEFLGEINNLKYKELVYQELHPTEKQLAGQEKFERLLQMREAAQKEFRDPLAFKRPENRMRIENSIDLVENCQIGDPANPTKFFSRALHNYIKSRFDERYVLKFFSAIGTQLDVAYGIDGFFKLYNQETGEELSRATFDITINTAKDSSAADTVIKIEPTERDKYDPSPNNSSYNQAFFNSKIQEFGESIIASLVQNYHLKTSQKRKN